MIDLPFENSTVARMQREEIARARRGVFSRPRRRAIISAWFAVYLLGFIPLILPMTLARADILLLVVGVVYGAQMLVSLRTALLASELVARLLRVAGNWDLLVMTGLDSRQTIWGTWAAVMRQRLSAHLLVGGLRVGALVGMAQYLHSAPLPGQVSSVLLPGALPFQIAHHPAFIYVGSLGTDVAMTFPWLPGILLALPLLLVFAVLEAAIVTAAGVFVGIVFGEYDTLRAIAGAAARVTMMIAGMTLLLTTAGTNLELLNEMRCVRQSACAGLPSAGTTSQADAMDAARNTLRLRETPQIALSPWVDGGVMIGAALARPSTPIYPHSTDFIGRVLVSAVIAMISLLFFGWLLSLLAQVAAISRGMAPSPNR